jgi:hypothetical protein
MTDLELILNTLGKEREDLHRQLMQIDRIIKRMKGGNFVEDQSEIISLEVQTVNPAPKGPLHTVGLGGSQDRAKVVILKVFDIVRHASKLREIQDEYNKVTGRKYNIRESLRALHRQGLLKLIKEKDAERGSYWVKSEWVKDNVLLPEYKPEGFDLLYHPDNIVFE